MVLKIIEWNINQRSGKSDKIPLLVQDVIKEMDADIVILTEFYKVNNWEDFVNKALENYYVFYSMNPSDQNDILIAIKKNSNSEIMTIKSLYSCNEEVPNFLHVDVKYGNTVLSVIGVRIRMVDYKMRYNEMQYALNHFKDIDNPIIVAGDFNNNRRGTTEVNWNMSKLDELFVGYKRSTPDGSSIYEEIKNDPKYEFAEDHFYSKKVNVKIKPYYRDFVEKDKNIYKWGKDFKIYLGKDECGKYKYETVPIGYPDHAVLIGEIEVK